MMKYLLSPLLLLTLIACNNTPIPFKNHTTPQSNNITQEYLNGLNFGKREIVPILINNHYFYVNKEGKKISTLTYNGEADKFSDGLARTKVNGKIGFFNSNLEIILKPVYDFAFPFHKGKAEICTGCKETMEEGVSMLEGGTWKKIDRNGLVIE